MSTISSRRPAASAVSAAAANERPRVVSLLPSATEILCLIEESYKNLSPSSSSSSSSSSSFLYDGLLVGRSHECDYPKYLSDVPVLTSSRITATDSLEIDTQVRQLLQPSSNQGGGGSFSLYNLDQHLLQQLRPSLIITQDLCSVCSIDFESVRSVAARMNPRPNIVSLNPKTIEDVLDNIEEVGRAINLEEDAKRAKAHLQARINNITDFVNQCRNIHGSNQEGKGSTAAGPPNVAFLEWLKPLFPAGHWTPQIIQMAGGVHPLGGGVGIPSVDIPYSSLIESNPTHIIIAPCGLSLSRTNEEVEKHLLTAEWFMELDAVKNGRVVLVDGNLYFNRSGPRLVDALEFTAGWIHNRPDLIPKDFPYKILEIPKSAFNRIAAPPTSTGEEEAEAATAAEKEEEKEEATNTKNASEPISPVKSSCSRQESEAAEIERCHEAACKAGQSTYKDPISGLTVMTELTHRRRGVCCGNRCRHCPFAHLNVPCSRSPVNQITKPTHLRIAKIRNKLAEVPEAVDILFWSGGKDSYLTLLSLLTEHARDPAHIESARKPILLTTFDGNSGEVPHQNVPFRDIMNQAKYLNMDLIAVPLPSRCGNAEYVSTIEKAIEHLKDCNIRLVFGDLHLSDIVKWRQANFNKYKTHFPLYQMEYKHLLSALKIYKKQGKSDSPYAQDFPLQLIPLDQEFVERYSYCSIRISAVNANLSDVGVIKVGDEYDSNLLERLPFGVDMMGENGEFHSFVDFK